MGKVTIYRFRLYDIAADENRLSRRWATLEAIARIGGEPLEDTGVDVDVALVGKEIPGMTGRGFDPRPRTGFQQSVSA